MLNSCIYFLEKTVNRCPDKIAVTDQFRSYTFNELRVSALRIAQAINPEGKNKPIAVFLPKSANSVVCFLGALYTGNFYVSLDFKSPRERLSKVLCNTNPEVILVDSQSEKTILEVLQGKQIKVINIDTVLSSSQEPNFDYLTRIKAVIDTDPIYCIFTSGSTGIPKGVLISHRSVVDYLEYMVECFQLNENSVFGNQTQFHFDVSVVDVYATLKLGASFHIIPEQHFIFPAKLMEYLDQKNINTIYWVPSAMNQVANADALSLLKNKTLEKILFAGEVMPTKTLNYWRKHFPKALFSNLYGPTEITVTCTYYTVDREFADHESLPIGIPCRNSDVMILDDQNRLISQKDTQSVGELCVRGSSLALGYWDDIEKTNSVFVQNPLNSHYQERIYRTGDFVKYNSRGEIEYHGRRDRQIKHMGYRIELGEIERAVLSFSDVDNASVLYDDAKKVIVCVFESKYQAMDENALRVRLAQVLPKYMIPSVYQKLEKLPISSAGKVDLMLIRKNYEERVKV